MSAPAAFVRHDHAACRRTALASAEAVCAERGLRLTAIRRRALEILLEAHEALGAYEVLRRMGDGERTPKPPTAYRALDFLVANGFAHRVEKLNAFVACARPGAAHRAAFAICTACGRVAEIEAVEAAERAAAAIGFAPSGSVVEVEGVCAPCQAAR